MKRSRLARYVTLLSMTAAAGCGLLAPSDEELMGGNTPAGADAGATANPPPPGATPPGTTTPGTTPPGTTPPPGTNPDAGGRGDAALPPGCDEVCSIVPTSCRSSPKCTCLFSGASCSNTTCSQQNGDITATCGSTVCSVSSGTLTCIKGGTSCPCN